MGAERPKEKVPIPDTDGWLRVTTTHVNVFYAQKKSKRSEWTVPDEIREQVERFEASLNGAAPDDDSGREAKRARIDEEQGTSDAPVDYGAAAPPPEEPEPAPAPSVPAPANLSLEEGQALFMAMLTSLNGTPYEINPMAPWDRELPKFVHLPSYSALPGTRERQDVFNEWCKLRLREKRSGGAARKPPAEQPRRHADSSEEHAYKRLLRDVVTSTRTTFPDFAASHSSDPRYSAYAANADASRLESLFRDWLYELGEIKRSLARKADQAFTQLLVERLPPQAELLERAQIPLAEAPRLSKDQAAGVWVQAKRTDGLAADKRYDAVGSATRRAELFADWLRRAETAPRPPPTASPLASAPAAPSQRPAHRERDRERALQQRQEQVRREQARLHARNRAAREDVVLEQRETDFRQLLVDAVRDPNLSWEAAQQQLRHDARFSVPNDVLPEEAKRAFFQEHAAHLRDRRRTQLARLFAKHARSEDGTERLDVAPEVVLTLTKNDDDYENTGVKLFVGDDPHVLQREFHEWDQWRQQRAREAFREMLGGTSRLRDGHG